MDPSKGDISSDEVVQVLSKEVTSSNSTEGPETETVLGDLSIDIQSINIQGNFTLILHIKVLLLHLFL